MKTKSKKVKIVAIVSTFAALAGFSILVTTLAKGETIFGQAENNDSPYILTLDRSVTAGEIAANKATFVTTGENPIDFKFNGASENASGLITLASGGYFYNDTKITGITKIETTLTSGSAILAYGNAKDALYVGSATLSGTSKITVTFTTPSDYFKIGNISGTLSISELSVTYSCSNTYSPDEHEGAEEFITSNAWADGLPNHYFVEPANSKVIDVTTDTIAFDVKFITTSGTLSFYLNQYFYGKYCGPFALSPSGVMTGAGASLTVLEDGWYRMTINLPSTTKGGDPEYVSKVNLSGTTANGFIKYMGLVQPDIHEGAKEFKAGGTWKDDTVNYYFVSPADSKVIDPETDTIAFDIKITSESGRINFYLNEYFYGRYVGPFVVTKTGGLSGTGASIAALEDGWYRLTINLAATAKSPTAPSFVSRINLASYTTGDGLIKYMGLVN